MFTKIYFNTRTLYLCDAITPELEPLLHQPETVLIDELNSHTVKAILREMTVPAIKTGIFLHPDLEDLQHHIFKKFRIVNAGGGAVFNDKNELLLIFRNGFWDLPKGKQDEGETIETCAVREVQEETGLQQVTIREPLMITYHTYEMSGLHILKPSHWFIMQAGGDNNTVPQLEEGISEIAWVAREKIQDYKAKTYPSIADVIDKLLLEI